MMIDTDKRINLSITYREFFQLWDLCNRLGDPEPLHTIIHRKADAIQKHEEYTKQKKNRTTSP